MENSDQERLGRVMVTLPSLFTRLSIFSLSFLVFERTAGWFWCLINKKTFQE